MDETLQNLVKQLNLTPEILEEVATTARTNPMAIFGLIQKLQLSPEVLQQLMQLLLSRPDLLNDIAQKAGVSREMLATMQSSLGGDQPQDTKQ